MHTEYVGAAEKKLHTDVLLICKKLTGNADMNALRAAVTDATMFDSAIKHALEFYYLTNNGGHQTQWLTATMAATSTYPGMPPDALKTQTDAILLANRPVVKMGWCKVCKCHGHHIGTCGTKKAVDKSIGANPLWK